MKILAILQNQWFHDPAKAERCIKQGLERFGPIYRDRFTALMLFAGCKTGRTLKTVFGQLIEDITWCEASTVIGGYAASAAPHDPDHLREVFFRHKPDVVIAFGLIAQKGVDEVLPLCAPPLTVSVLKAPHPAARGGEVLSRLIAIRDQLIQIRQHATRP